jgi:Fe-S-cluster-containing hydrogenase component 2
MLANYGYKDGSGDFFITIDTDKCNGCGKCIPACPAGVLELVTDESDPFRELPVAVVTEAHRKKIKYSCSSCKGAQCKPPGQKIDLPCLKSCEINAINHSW